LSLNKKAAIPATIYIIGIPKNFPLLNIYNPNFSLIDLPSGVKNNKPAINNNIEAGIPK
jgi:hypothetical protein